MLSSTSKQFQQICQDEQIWALRYFTDWNDVFHDAAKRFTSRNDGETLSIKENDKNFYRSKYKCRYNSMNLKPLTQADLDIKNGFFILVSSEAKHSLQLSHHLLLTPFKILGILTFPIHWLCEYQLQKPIPPPALASLRLFVIDLTFQMRSNTNIWTLHRFFFLNILAAGILLLDRVAILLTLTQWMVILIGTFWGPIWYTSDVHRGISQSLLFLFLVWQIIWFPLLLLVNLQYLIIPFTVINRKNIFNLLCSVDSLKDMCQYLPSPLLPNLETNLNTNHHNYLDIINISIAQLFWIPAL